MKKITKILLNKSLESLILSIDHFNRPWDKGRIPAVLILLDHSFEMFLKAGIIHQGGDIQETHSKNTIGFDACVRKALSNAEIKFLTKEQALILQAINGLRDAAQHYFLDISEQLLYTHAQAGLTLFRDLYKKVFQRNLREELPVRVLPISTKPPADFANLFDNEIKSVQSLLIPGKRRHIEAKGKLRTLAVLNNALLGKNLQPEEKEIDSIVRKLKENKEWVDLFPGVASINITAKGYGPSLDLRLTKKKGVPIQLVPEGTPGATTVAVRRVDELGFYNLGRNQLADKIGKTGPKTNAIIWHLKLKDDPDCYKIFQIGKSEFGRYSQKALTQIKQALPNLSMDEVWKCYKARSNN